MILSKWLLVLSKPFLLDKGRAADGLRGSFDNNFGCLDFTFVEPQSLFSALSVIRISGSGEARGLPRSENVHKN